MNQGKPSLESLATETLLQIMRHLIFDNDTVVYGPLPENEDGMPRRSLSILRVSKQFYTLASSVFYGENNFVLSEDSIIYHRHNSGSHNGPQNTRTVLLKRNADKDWFTTYATESVNRMDMLSIAAPAQNLLKHLSIAASQGVMNHYYDYSLVTILMRMRALKSLRFLFKEQEVGNGLRYFENQGEGPESNGRRFMYIIDCELAHVKKVTVEDLTMMYHSIKYSVALQQVMSALGERNKEWEPPQETVQTFWGKFEGKHVWVRSPVGLCLVPFRETPSWVVRICDEVAIARYRGYTGAKIAW